MNKHEIFISFNICCNNSENYIEQTLQSIFNQTYKNWEIVIVNDGSIDNTELIIEKYIKQGYPINYIKQNKIGFPQARNIALQNSKAEWIAIIDHDDLCHKNRLINQVSEIKKNNDCKLFFGDVDKFDEQGNINTKFKSEYSHNFSPRNFDLKNGSAYNKLIQYGCFICSSSVIFNKNVANEIGCFDESYKFISDFIFFLKFSETFNIYCSDKIISKWRSHSSQASSIMSFISFKELNRLYFSLYFQKKIGFMLKKDVFLKQIRLIIHYLRKK